MSISETGCPRLFPKTSQTLPGSSTVVPSAERTVSNSVRVVARVWADKVAKANDIDGFLVGGASLKPEFIDICKANN